VAAGGVGLFLWVGPGEALDHFRRVESAQNEPSFAARLLVWRGTLDLFADHPALGAGLGAYPAAFLRHYPAGTERLWLQAHNDYVQILAEVGIVGAALAAYALLVFLVRLLAPLASRRGVRERFVYYGLVTGVLAILIHSAVDFNLQIPANGAFFVTCCGLALAHRNLFRREA
jgi:O-antigen ligase